MRIAFIGGGRMAESIIGAMISTGAANPGDISVFDIVPARRELLAEQFRVTTPDTAAATVSGVHTVVLAVLPGNVQQVAADIADHLAPDALVLSIMAGVRIAEIAAHFPGCEKCARIMPNTLVGTGHGYSALHAGPGVGPAERATIDAILNALGQTVELPEDMFATFTAYCAAPSVFYVAAAAMIDAGVRAGFSRPIATAMTFENVVGAGLRAQAHPGHPFELLDAMTSPGGVTAEAVAAMHERGLPSAVMEAIAQAIAHSKTLG